MVEVVGIEEDDVFSSSKGDASVHGFVDAAVSHAEDADVVLRVVVRFEEVESPVGGCSVDDEVFEFHASLLLYGVKVFGKRLFASVGNGIEADGHDGHLWRNRSVVADGRLQQEWTQ